MTIDSTPAVLYSPEYYQDPYPTLDWFREHSPVCEIIFPIGNVPVWLVTGYQNIQALLADPRFSTDSKFASASFQAAGLGFAPLGTTLALTDPPVHTRLRKLAMKTFTPRNIEGWRPTVHAVVDSLLDGFEAASEIDVVADYASVVPAEMITQILGIQAEPGFVRKHATAIGSGDPEQLVAACDAMRDYTEQLVSEKRQSLGDDLSSQLISARDDSDRLSEEELVSMILIIIVAGFDTTSNLIANGVLALLDHPDQLRLLRDRPELAANAVEEFLRYAGSVTNSWRFAKESTDFAGTRLPAGAPLLQAGLSANRDPAQFADPHTLDITRADLRHLAFGHGIHNCIGAALARLAGKTAIQSLVERFPNMRLGVPRQDITYRHSMFLRSLTALPVVL